MIIVSGTSPLLTLWKVGHLELLPTLYREVVIPTQVESEIRSDEHAASAEAVLQVY